MNKKRHVRRVAAAVGMLVLTSGIYLGGLRASGNFHEVKAGEFYRSAQPSADALSRYIDRHGIRTVINLRGASPGPPAHEAGRAVTGRRCLPGSRSAR